MLDNLKKLTSEMDVKRDFVNKVAKNYNLNEVYVLQNWFQNRWKIPANELPTIVKMAQNYLYIQTKRKQNLLLQTGFKSI
jgi:S-adenosylmethionine:diacylglycerol 3-amino-3-carboxypropyl transferase